MTDAPLLRALGAWCPRPWHEGLDALSARARAGLVLLLGVWAGLVTAGLCALAAVVTSGALLSPTALEGEVTRRVDLALGSAVVELARLEVRAEATALAAQDELEVARYALSLCRSRQAAAADRETALTAQVTVARERCQRPGF